MYNEDNFGSFSKYANELSHPPLNPLPSREGKERSSNQWYTLPCILMKEEPEELTK